MNKLPVLALASAILSNSLGAGFPNLFVAYCARQRAAAFQPTPRIGDAHIGKGVS
ncbi:MAG: hypothetical protein ABSC08_09460 [Bryobacteraceae bacterium]